MDLLVVGASGFLGRNLVAAACSKGWKVTGTYLNSANFGTYAEKLGFSAVRFEQPQRGRWDADVCVFVAGNSNHHLHPLDDLRMNVESLVTFLDSFEGGLVFLSSSAVYEGSEGQVSPSTQPNPKLPYSISKSSAERYVWSRASADALRWATVVRLYYAYGPYDRPTRLIPRAVETHIMGRPRFKLTSAPGTLLDPLYAADVAQALLKASEGRAKGLTLDLCGGNPRPVKALVDEIFATLGSDPEVVHEQRPQETGVAFYSDPGPTRERLGLDDPAPLSDGIRRYLEWRRALG